MGWEAVGLAATIVIRSYNNIGVPPADLAAAREHTQTVVRQAGLNLVWADCPAGDGPAADAPARCEEPVGGDIVLRLQRARRTQRSAAVSMGFSLVRTDGGPAFLATVYVDRVATVARETGADVRRLLGLAIAHEIGHVLLNSNSHAASGLMRASWSRADLRRAESSTWLFLEGEAARIRSSALARQ